jgi:hypothetical protein
MHFVVCGLSVVDLYDDHQILRVSKQAKQQLGLILIGDRPQTTNNRQSN